MDPTMLFVVLIEWIMKKCPSLEQYVQYALPITLSILMGFGMFTNMLPLPGHKFPVPDVAELEKELEGGGGFIVRMAKFARSNVIAINWFLGTVIYSWFYNFTNRLARLTGKATTFLPKLFKKKKA